MAAGRSVGAYTLGVVSAALLSWEVALGRCGLSHNCDNHDLPPAKRRMISDPAKITEQADSICRRIAVFVAGELSSHLDSPDAGQAIETRIVLACSMAWIPRGYPQYITTRPWKSELKSIRHFHVPALKTPARPVTRPSPTSSQRVRDITLGRLGHASPS